MSLDVETHAESHAHKTGHRWVDMVIAFSALFISLVSLGVAIIHGRTMENMAAANARLVAANSWPFLAYGAGLNTVDGIPTIHMQVVNTGVGPAKVESAELVWKGVSYRRDQDFLAACCGYEPEAGRISTLNFLPSQVLRAGERIVFLGFQQPAGPEVFAALQRAMLSRDLQLHICFCSIFDECWKSDMTTHSLKPKPVQACVEPKVQFDQGILNGET